MVEQEQKAVQLVHEHTHETRLAVDSDHGALELRICDDGLGGQPTSAPVGTPAAWRRSPRRVRRCSTTSPTGSSRCSTCEGGLMGRERSNVGQRERLAGAELPNTSPAVVLACRSSFNASVLASVSPLGVSWMTLSNASFSCSPPE